VKTTNIDVYLILLIGVLNKRLFFANFKDGIGHKVLKPDIVLALNASTISGFFFGLKPVINKNIKVDK